MKHVAAGLIALSVVFCARAGYYSTPALPNIDTNNIVVVTNAAYGAVGDGVTTNTTAIQAAIAVAAAGATTNGATGGTVFFPPGIYLCGPITMASSVNLQVGPGAILRMLPLGMYPGGTNTGTTFISASSLHDIEISGPGAIDGQGAAWWPYSGMPRPIMIGPNSCNRLLIQNITLSNSPMFHIAVGGNGGNTTVQNVTVFAPGTSPNTDACDTSGTNILVQNCNISEGDDDFTCGGGTSGVLLTNNTYGTGHGISIGSYTDAGGVSNIMVINCTMNGTENGIRLKSERGRGGLIQNLGYYNVSMTNVEWPLLVYSYYEFGLGTLININPEYAANVVLTNYTAYTSTDPIWQNITFSNINATMPSGDPPLMVWGLPEALASNIVFRSVNITSSSASPPEVYNATNIQFIDCSFNLPAGVKDMESWNAGIVISNTFGGQATTNLWILNGLTTNGYGNSFQFYNALGTLANTNALGDGPLILADSTFTVSNNLTLTPDTALGFVLDTNAATLAVAGNLELGGTNFVSAGPGFTNGSFTLMTYTGALSGSLPTLANPPSGYSFTYNTNTTGLVKLVALDTNLAVPAAPTNVAAVAGNSLVTITWSPVSTATSYNVNRSFVSNGSYSSIAATAATNYSDSLVTNGATYYYVISAQDAAGQSPNSAEVSATPSAPTYTVVTTNVFTDAFAYSTVNAIPAAAPTATNTSYEILSTKPWSPTPSIAAGHFKFGIAGTSSGVIEAQGLFTTSPVILQMAGDTISVIVTYTNTTGLLTQTNALALGLYNSSQIPPVAGGLNSTATSSYSTNTTGGAQLWAGYAGQLNFTNAGSQIITRPPQTTGTLANNDQDTLTTGSGSSSFNFPAASVVGAAAASASIPLTNGSPYTEVLTITLTGTGTLAITNTLYGGASTNGAWLEQYSAVASGSTYLTNSFDALAIGWRASASPTTAIDINRITVNSTLSVAATDQTPAPAAPANLGAMATNLLINLAWNTVNGATNYNLKRGTVAGAYPTVVSLAATNYGDANVTNAVNYFYVVSAVGIGGESTNSLPVNAAPLPSNQPSNILAQVLGNQLQLSWPQNHLGWRLQIQTNGLAAGLGGNWATVPNSTNVVETNILINPTNGSVFLRLVYP